MKLGQLISGLINRRKKISKDKFVALLKSTEMEVNIPQEWGGWLTHSLKIKGFSIKCCWYSNDVSIEYLNFDVYDENQRKLSDDDIELLVLKYVKLTEFDLDDINNSIKYLKLNEMSIDEFIDQIKGASIKTAKYKQGEDIDNEWGYISRELTIFGFKVVYTNSYIYRRSYPTHIRFEKQILFSGDSDNKPQVWNIKYQSFDIVRYDYMFDGEYCYPNLFSEKRICAILLTNTDIGTLNFEVFNDAVYEEFKEPCNLVTT